jgi:hypothetical protein
MLKGFSIHGTKPLAGIAFVDVRTLCQFFTRGWSQPGQGFEETETVADARHHRYGQAGGVSQHFAYEGIGLCLIDTLLCCHVFSPFSACKLFVYPVVTRLIPTVTSSMLEKGGFAIVEKYGDSAKAVPRLCTGDHVECF